MVELHFSSTFLNGFEVSRCLQRDQMKKDCNKVVRELVLFCMFRGLEYSLRLTSTLKKEEEIDSVHVSFGNKAIIRFTLDK